MSSYRTLNFNARQPDREWSVTTRDLTVIVRRVATGYLAFLQKWSDDVNAYHMESVPSEEAFAVFPTRIAAESACQLRYEQELRWMHTHLR